MLPDNPWIAFKPASVPLLHNEQAIRMEASEIQLVTQQHHCLFPCLLALQALLPCSSSQWLQPVIAHTGHSAVKCNNVALESACDGLLP